MRNRSNLTQIGTVRCCAADGVASVGADEEVEIGTFPRKRVIGRHTERVATLPPAMLSNRHARIDSHVEMRSGAHTAIRCFDRDPVALGDVAGPGRFRVKIHVWIASVLSQAGQGAVLTLTE